VGVGGIVQPVGRGTVKFSLQYEGKTYTFTLCNVLHVPGNRNNLLSLGRRECHGGSFIGGMQIMLIMSNGICVAEGPLVANNLYKIPFKIIYPNAETQHTFQTIRGVMPWEIWHQRLGHIGYDALNQMQHLNLVDGLNIEQNSSKSDCIPCI
jgi:hypothetical protein